MLEEGMKTTPNKLIHIGCPIPFNADLFLQQLEALMIAVYEEKDEIKEMVAEVVPTYHPDNTDHKTIQVQKNKEQMQHPEIIQNDLGPNPLYVN
jgi:hypothetical protein